MAYPARCLFQFLFWDYIKVRSQIQLLTSITRRDCFQRETLRWVHYFIQSKICSCRELTEDLPNFSFLLWIFRYHCFCRYLPNMSWQLLDLILSDKKMKNNLLLLIINSLKCYFANTEAKHTRMKRATYEYAPTSLPSNTGSLRKRTAWALLTPQIREYKQDKKAGNCCGKEEWVLKIQGGRKAVLFL